MSARITSGLHAGQTFTARFSGRLLFVQLEVAQTVGGGDLIFDVRPATNDGPNENDASILATLTLSDGTLGASPALQNFVVEDQEVEVTAGEVYAITLRATGGTYSWLGHGSGEYSRGAGYYRNAGGPWLAGTGNMDLVFATWVGIFRM